MPCDKQLPVSENSRCYRNTTPLPISHCSSLAHSAALDFTMRFSTLMASATVFSIHVITVASYICFLAEAHESGAITVERVSASPSTLLPFTSCLTNDSAITCLPFWTSRPFSLCCLTVRQVCLSTASAGGHAWCQKERRRS